jgi:arylsulfatase A-like enzyme
MAKGNQRQGRRPRHQFHHVIDIVPTILEATGIRQPEYVDGIKQSPIEGVSMFYTFDKKHENAPSTHRTQYFEMFGDRALYHDGWLASTKVMRAPWVHFPPKVDVLDYPWELYDLTKDWTQYEDVAAKHPGKLKEMQDLFWIRTRKEFLDFPVATTSSAAMSSMALR